MAKKLILFFIVVLILVGGGFFYWRDQTDVRKLNKNLPEGIKVVKSLTGEYGVVNKIDGYEFKVPKEWKGIKEMEYIETRETQGYIGTSMNIEGNTGTGRSIGIDRYTSGGNMNAELKLWVEENFRTFGLTGDFDNAKVVNFSVIKTQESVHLGGEYVYFFKNNSIIYGLTSPSEITIRYIISNGKW